MVIHRIIIHQIILIQKQRHRRLMIIEDIDIIHLIDIDTVHIHRIHDHDQEQLILTPPNNNNNNIASIASCLKRKKSKEYILL